MSRLLVIALAGASLILTGGVTDSPASSAAAARNDQWTVIGPGGGGAMFRPTISPHTPNDVLLRCDMTGAYISHDGGQSWRMFNLRGVVDFFVFDPLDPKTIYARTIGLFRSTDRGNTWQLVYPAPELVARIDMPDDHAGERITTKEGRAPAVTALAVDPANSKVLYAAMSDARGTSVLQLSTDWGKRWTASGTLPDGAFRIYIDPHSPKQDRTLYVVGRHAVAVREAGKWHTGAQPKSQYPISDASAGFGANGGRPVIYAITAPGEIAPGQLHISRDGGASWETTQIGAPADVRAVAASERHPNVAYVSYNNMREGSPDPKHPWFGVARTTDAGKTWQLVWKENDKVAANVHDAWQTARFGPEWGESPINLGVSPTDPDVAYGTDFGRAMRTTDAGATWYAVNSRKVPGGYTTAGLDVTTCYGIHFDPFDKQRMFISYTDIGLFGSDNGGNSWYSATTGVPRQWNNTTYWMEFDPQVKSRAWAVASGIHDLPRPKMWRRGGISRYNGGVIRTDDGGKTWRVESTNLPQTAATHILLDPNSPASSRTLYVTGFARGVFKSVDGGRTWALKNRGIVQNEPFAWRLARDRNGVLYLVVPRRSDDGTGDGALYRSRDGAESWERIALPKGVNGPNGLLVDAAEPDRLYLAAWGRDNKTAAVDGGIYLSLDGGRSWRNVLSKDQHVYDITADARDSKLLYASGFESSAWRSADRGETWTRLKGYNFKWGHRVIPDPYDPKRVYVLTYCGSVWHGPASGDPNAVEDITTPQVAYGR
jgi:photosystem II stability/assembly factor-like uncharacterized protein